MKNLTKQIFASIIMACSLLACSPTNDLINDVKEEAMVGKPMRRSAGSNLLNALTLDSIAQADAMLEAMQAVDDAETFYNTYLSNNVNNKYLNSIYEYMSIIEAIEEGDSVNAMFAFEALRDSMFNVYIEGNDTIAEPLANFDYRCLVNDDNVFVVDDRVYHLFDTIFITCPIDQHTELLEISKNKFRMQLLIADLKAEKKELSDTMMIKQRSVNSTADYDIVYLYPSTGKVRYTFEKSVGKRRMQVLIDSEENYVKFLNRHDLKTKYTVKSHKKCLGIWWIQRVRTNIFITYDALFTYGSNVVELAPYNAYVHMRDNRIVTAFYPSEDAINWYAFTKLPYICNEGLINIDFTISNPDLTITEADFKSVRPY